MSLHPERRRLPRDRGTRPSARITTSPPTGTAPVAGSRRTAISLGRPAKRPCLGTSAGQLRHGGRGAERRVPGEVEFLSHGEDARRHAVIAHVDVAEGGLEARGLFDGHGGTLGFGEQQIHLSDFGFFLSYPAMVPPDRTKWRIKREPGAPYPSGSNSGAVPATVSGRACSLHATGDDPWEGEHIDLDHREPGDLPDNWKPFSGAGVPKEDGNVCARSPGQKP